MGGQQAAAGLVKPAHSPDLALPVSPDTCSASYTSSQLSLGRAKLFPVSGPVPQSFHILIHSFFLWLVLLNLEISSKRSLQTLSQTS